MSARRGPQASTQERSDEHDRSHQRQSQPSSLAEAGTSPWLDLLRRSLVQDGELARLIAEDSLKGDDLEPVDLREGDPRLRRLRRRADGGAAGEDLDAQAIYERARHQGRPASPAMCCAITWESSNHQDGFVSLEVGGRPGPRRAEVDRGRARLLAARQPPERDDQDPGHARGRRRDRAGDLRGHQHQHHAAVRRRGLREGRRGLSQGPRAPPARGQAAGRRLGGELLRLARRHRRRQAPGGLRPRGALRQGGDRQRPRGLPQLRGASSPARAGRRCITPAPTSQRPLWASTGVKNERYPDTMYVDELVGAHTVNTMPLATLEAVADHGHISGPTAQRDPAEDLEALAEAGIDLGEVTDELLVDGVKQFEDAMTRLLDGIEERRQAAVASASPDGAGRRLIRPRPRGGNAMQIGFVGLGKMGGNMVNRIRRDSDHEVVAFDSSSEARRGRRRARRRPARTRSRTLVDTARSAASGVDHGPGRQADRGHARQAARAPVSGRHDRRRRELQVDRVDRPPRQMRRARRPLRRRRDERRGVGPGDRLLHDGRRRGRSRSGGSRRSSTCSRSGARATAGATWAARVPATS